MHGGVTWNGSVNRNQLRDRAKLIGKLAPLIIELMMENPDAFLGDVC
jgi:hypothetical protein